LGKANDQAMFKKCVEILTNLEKTVQAKMGLKPGGQAGGAPGQSSVLSKDVQFTETNKENMLKYLNQSISVVQMTKQCYSSSSTMEQVQGCMQQAAGTAK
jgi:hypothetical protein